MRMNFKKKILAFVMAAIWLLSISSSSLAAEPVAELYGEGVACSDVNMVMRSYANDVDRKEDHELPSGA